MRNEYGKSDRLIVPRKSLNKARLMAAEEMEGKGADQGESNKDARLTALMHHIYRIDTLRSPT
jgi:hypothetical protein